MILEAAVVVPRHDGRFDIAYPCCGAKRGLCARRLEFGVQYQDVEFVKLVDDFFSLVGHEIPHLYGHDV